MTKKDRMMVSGDIAANIFFAGLAMWVWSFVDWWINDPAIIAVSKALMFVAGPAAIVSYIRAAMTESK